MPETVTRCAGCDSPRLREAAEARAFFGLPAGYGMVRCAGCGLIFMNPRPTQAEYEAFYGSEPFYDPARYAPEMRRHGRFFERRWEDLESGLGRPGAALDLGCGPGWFMAVGARRGWRVDGIEISAPFRDYARTELGLSVRAAGAGGAIPFPDESFDVLVMNHVLEHLVDPLATLRECRRVLRPGGRLLVEVPYQMRSLKELLRGVIRRGTGAWGRGRLWRDKDVPLHHVLYFSPRTLMGIVRRAGFRPFRLRTYIPRDPWSNAGRPLGGRWLTEGLHVAGSWFRRGPVLEVLAGKSLS